MELNERDSGMAEAILSQALARRRIFLTGHTGFKGSWLLVWLSRLGCEVTGYSLAPKDPSLFVQAGLSDLAARHIIGDVRDAASLTRALHEAEPELVVHMAAQPLVRRAHLAPVDTWLTNAVGTLNVLEAIRTCRSVQAAVFVTTDKVYENREWDWGYREIDPLGGPEPYSASKAAAELAVQSYRNAYFRDEGPLIATARAGNVIGGGDWSEDRIIPDAARAAMANKPLTIRYPKATRPWQHVLDCLSGYLSLAANLLAGSRECAAAYNFGPPVTDNVSVADLLAHLRQHWPELRWVFDGSAGEAAGAHEATFLYLDPSLARRALGWRPTWPLSTALAVTAEWYRTVISDPGLTREVTCEQLDRFQLSMAGTESSILRTEKLQLAGN